MGLLRDCKTSRNLQEPLFEALGDTESHRDVEHCPRLGSDEYSTAPGPVSGVYIVLHTAGGRGVYCPRLGSDEYSTAPGPVSGCGAYT